MSLVHPVSWQPSKFEFGELQWRPFPWADSEQERSFSRLGRLLPDVPQDLDGCSADAEDVDGPAGMLGEACGLDDRDRVAGQGGPLFVVSIGGKIGQLDEIFLQDAGVGGGETAVACVTHTGWLDGSDVCCGGTLFRQRPARPGAQWVQVCPRFTQTQFLHVELLLLHRQHGGAIPSVKLRPGGSGASWRYCK